MENFLGKNKIYLAISAYLIVVLLALFFLARPMIMGMKEKNDDMQKKMIDQKIKAEKLSNLKSIKNQFESLKDQEGKVKISLNKDNVVSLIERLENISEETGNKIKIEMPKEEAVSKSPSKSSQPGDKKEKNIVENLPSDKYIKMTITLEGKYENFFNFLRKMENMDYYSDVTSIKISKLKDAQSSSSNPFWGSSNVSKESNPGSENDIISILGAVFYLEK